MMIKEIKLIIILILFQKIGIDNTKQFKKNRIKEKQY